MPGTVTIAIASPGFGRAGRVRVSIDGAKVGKLRQGESHDLALEPGQHRFQISGGGCRSKVVVVEVAEGGHAYLNAGVHQGLMPAAVLCAGILGYFTGILVTLPVCLVLVAIPGSWFYLRSSQAPQVSDSLEIAEEAAVVATAATDEPWWLSDPNLAKRYRKG